jgi:hypothetical protein
MVDAECQQVEFWKIKLDQVNELEERFPHGE